MKTIDTSKLWVINPSTETTVPEICGPGGICLDAHGANDEQAQEIADMLNGASILEGVAGQLAEFAAPYTITLRAGDCDVVYSGFDPDEVVSMMKQGEQRMECAGSNTVVNLAGMSEVAASAVISDAMERGATLDESTPFVMHGRQGGKTTAMLQDAQKKLQFAYAANLELEQKTIKLQSDLAAAQERFEEADHLRRTWEMSAASYLNSMHWYQEQLDRCGVALGKEAYVADDGSVQDKPLRAKVAEMVEALCAERPNLRNAVIEECAQFVEGGRFLHDDSPSKVFAIACAQEMRKQMLTKNRVVNADMATHSRNATDFDVAEARLTDAQRAQIREAALSVSQDKRGPCVRRAVRATIVTPDGRRFVGENDCANPQQICPRSNMPTGVGYHLRKEVCQQSGHAETEALKVAGPAAKGAAMYIEGHTYVCDPCTAAAGLAGIKFIKIGKPPAPHGAGEACGCATKLPVPGLQTLRSGIRTLQSGRDGCVMNIRFETLKALQEAAREFHALEAFIDDAAK